MTAPEPAQGDPLPGLSEALVRVGLKNWNYCTGEGSCVLTFESEADLEEFLSIVGNGSTYPSGKEPWDLDGPDPTEEVTEVFLPREDWADVLKSIRRYAAVMN
jgi:hypothetical protein